MRKKVLLSITMVLALILVFWIARPEVAAAKRTNKEVWATAGDTSTELQYLLNYNRAGQYNLTIRIPAGNYILSKELKIFSNTTIIADKETRLIKNHQKGAMLANDLSNDKGGYTTTVNIKIIGGLWDSAKVAYLDKGTESLRFIHASNVTVKDATICNVPEGSHLVTFAGVKNGILDNCVLYGYIGTREKEAVQLDIVHDNEMIYSMQAKYLVFDDLACDGITIKNCEIYDYPRAIGSHTSVKGVFHKNIVITNNYLHTLDEAAVKAYNYTDLEISNNRIENAGVGILVYTYMINEERHYKEALKKTVLEVMPKNYNIVISGNTIKNIHKVRSDGTTKWGDAIRVLGSAKRPISGVVLKENTIARTERFGIFAEAAPKCKISNNTVVSTGRSGIYLIEGDSSVVLNNTVTKAGTTDKTAGGIGALHSNKVTISGNNIKSPAKNGIFLYTKSRSCSILKNIIYAAGENGISIYQQSNDAIVTNNKITSYGKRGIFIYEVGSATIKSNSILGKIGNGSEDALQIIADSSSKNAFVVKTNTFKSSNRYGMYIKNARKSYIVSNTIENTVKHALYLEASNYSKVYYNKIKNAGTSGSMEGGIGVSKSKKVTVYKNTVTNAAKNGIFLYNKSTTCTIKGNTITAAGDNAISVNNKSNSAKIVTNIIIGNKIKGSNNRGIFVFDSKKAWISKNVIKGCKVDRKL